MEKSLERFHKAQTGSWAGYATALAEIREGRKKGHWIWYVFPQIEGLGRSSTAQEFSLRDLDAACAYLRDPILRSRYAEIAATAAEQLAAGVPLKRLMGGSTDALKLASSATLFHAAAARLTLHESDFAGLARICDGILQATAQQGYGPCQFTLERCAL